MKRVFLALSVFLFVCCTSRNSQSESGDNYEGWCAAPKSANLNLVYSGKTDIKSDDPRFLATFGYTNSKKAICSGIMISPTIGITAAHCLAEEKNLERVSFARLPPASPKTSGKQTVQVLRYGSHPKFDFKLPVDTAGFDIAWIEVESEQNYLPIEKNWSAVSPGLSVTLVGYGNDNSDSYIKRSGEAKIARAIGKITNSGNTFEKIVTVEDGLAAGPCPGDSGGPLFSKQNTVIGVVHGVNTVFFPGLSLEDCGKCAPGLGSYVFPAHFLDWLQAQTGVTF